MTYWQSYFTIRVEYTAGVAPAVIAVAFDSSRRAVAWSRCRDAAAGARRRRRPTTTWRVAAGDAAAAAA